MTYKKELPRFWENKSKIYGLPYDKKIRKAYLGIGNSTEIKIDLYDPPELFLEKIETEEEPLAIFHAETEATQYRDEIYEPADCDIVWVRIRGSASAVPAGYHYHGCDITYKPSHSGAFSIINDCMFICRWHGCDEEGIAFLDYYNQLNISGLFDDEDTALEYMKHYLSFDWTERGEYYICEVFRQII